MYLYEHQRINPNDKFTRLEKHILSNEALHKFFKNDWGRISTKQYCGIINFEDEDYFILPKITNENTKNLNIFMYMLMYTNNIKLENEQIASCMNHKHNVIEAFIQIFAQNLFKELRKGIYKEYITEQDNLTALKGKYLINENIKYNFSKNKIYCEYDEFSMNNILNQFFLYAIKTLMKSVKDKKLLKQCELIFDEVENTTFDINHVPLHFNRLNKRFKDSFELALLLLNQYIPLFQQDKKSFAFLFDMNVLFERFIGKIVKNNFEDVKTPKGNKKFGELYLRPDIIVDSKKLIIDCKYKIIEDDEIASSDDRYQMYVYANNFSDIEITMLLYPKHFTHEKEISKELLLGNNSKKVRLKIKSIDLEHDTTEYNKYIHKIERDIRIMLNDETR